MKNLNKSGSLDMSEIGKSELLSRRRTLSLLAAFGLAAPSMLLTASETEAQTTGMERRQERRMGARNGVRSAEQDAPSDAWSGAQDVQNGARSGATE
jgi:hypothetical protein